jgi:phosphoadenosine phosphosulfate reductase
VRDVSTTADLQEAVDPEAVPATAAANAAVAPPSTSTVTPVELLPQLSELAEISRGFETKPASSVVQWAADRYGSGLVLAASFQDCVMIDVAVQAVPDIEVVFLDTQYHFAETLWYVEQVRAKYDLNLTVMRPKATLDDLWHADPDQCCHVRKVEPLERALRGRAAWMTGLRRDEAASRANTPIVSYDQRKGLVKVNPLATWTDLDVQGYIKDRNLPVHPLVERGYSSIGCWPCTRPVGEGEDARAGRWAGLDKTECGLHT